MKLAFLYGWNNSWDTWSTPAGMALELIDQGHQISTYNLKQLADIKRVAQNSSKYDAVCLWHAGALPSEIVPVWEKRNFQQTLMVAEGGDDPQVFEWNLKHTMPADIIHTPDIETCHKYRQQGKKAYWLTHWGDERIYHPIEPANTGLVVTTGGPRPGMWEKCMQLLANQLGSRFCNPRLDGGPYLSPSDNNKLYASADIIIQISGYGEVTRRIFEAASSRRLVIADKLADSKGMSLLMADKKHLVLFDSPEDCLSKVKFYLSKSSLRHQIANQGFSHVNKHHSVKMRAQQFIAIIKENV